MREITLKIYSFDELNEEVQKQVIGKYREECAAWYSRADWEDAQATIDRVQEIVGIKFDIQQSSQGFYVKWYTAYNSENEDRVDWEIFVEKMKDFKIDYWCDANIVNLLNGFVFDERRSFASNVGNLLVEFCEGINDLCSTYYEDDCCVKEFIDAMEVEFLENGDMFA